MGKPYIITEENFEVAAAPPGFRSVSEATRAAKIVGKNHFGLVPRNYTKYPLCYSKRAVTLDVPLIPRDQIVERIQEGHAKKQFPSYYRRIGGPNGGKIPSLNQNGQGFCWMYDPVIAVMVLRAMHNLPYVRLSAHGPACLVKNFRDEGGWAALALEHLTQYGVPSTQFWPEQSMGRNNVTDAMKANALLHRPAETFIDLVPSVYNRNLTEDQRLTCLVTNTIVCADRNRWAHSTADIELVLSQQAQKKKSLLKTRLQDLDLNDAKDSKAFYAVIATKGWNSWGDEWGDDGEFIMEGNLQRMDGGGAVRWTNPSIN